MNDAATSPPAHLVLSSVARIADFERRTPEPRMLPRSQWETGDYVLADVLPSGSVPFPIEDPSGRRVELLPGDTLLGALGRRAATLGVVGDWRGVGEDLELHTLNAAGVLGRVSSTTTVRPPIADLRYGGHATRNGEKLTMGDFVAPTPGRELDAAVVLIVGTSMEAGKTVAGKAIVRALKRLGMRVAATKLTGVGRYRDVLAMGDAGADAIADFVDAGLPSTATSREEFEGAMGVLLSMLATSEPDAVVAEAGASPLEPYNGEAAVQMLGDRVRCTVLCASDPYAVVGVMHAFGIEPDLVSGRAADNDAGIALTEKLAGKPALNLLDPASTSGLEALLAERLGVGGRDRMLSP